MSFALLTATPDPPPSFVPGGGSPWSMLLGLLVLAGMLAGTYWLSRRLGRSRAGSNLKVIDRLMLGRDACVTLVEISGRVFALGVGRDSVCLLCELTNTPTPEAVPAEQPERPSAPAGVSEGKKQGFSADYQSAFEAIRKMGLTAAPAVEEKPKEEPTPSPAAQRALQALEAPQQGGGLDDLFDRISQRQQRYTNKGKREKEK